MHDSCAAGTRGKRQGASNRGGGGDADGQAPHTAVSAATLAAPLRLGCRCRLAICSLNPRLERDSLAQARMARCRPCSRSASV